MAAALLSAARVEGQGAPKAPEPPTGTKIVSGRHFDVYVSKLEEKPLADGGTMKVYMVIAVAKTQRHGTQRIRRRTETINSDLLDVKNWEVVDFDKDGWDDYRYVAGVSKTGCRTWEAQRWQPDHDRFTSAKEFARWVDAKGKALDGSCIGK